MSTQQFEEKYYKYKDLLFRIIFTYVKNPNDAEDILQEVFTKLYCSNKAFETDEHEKRWLIRISINLSKNHLKLFWNKKRDIFNHEDLPGESFSSEYNDLLQMVLNSLTNVKLQCICIITKDIPVSKLVKYLAVKNQQLKWD